MSIRNLLSNLRSKFSQSRTGGAFTSPVEQRPHSGLVQTVISRSDTQTGVKTPISRTPIRAAPVMTVQPVDRMYDR